MNDRSDASYKALTSRDPRFDGVFFVGVTSTKIYCRPICPVKTPKQANCRFYDSAEAAEKQGFRPCLRCRPELAPGNAPVDDAHRIAHLFAHRIEEGQIGSGASLETIAAQFELSARQIRRIVHKEMGVSPIEYLQTRRLLLAKQLLTETALPITEIAFASGFASLRRFNAAFLARYRMPPTRLRKQVACGKKDAAPETVTVQLAYRPPYDWQGMLDFLHLRVLKGVEQVTPHEYRRTVRLGKHKGWLRVRHAPEKRALLVECAYSLMPVLPVVLARLKNLFDLAARPDLIAAHLRQDKILKKSVDKNPGLRVPGAFDGFELALRAILGQQITVKAATTLAGRVVEACGEKIVTPYAELHRLTPLPEKIAGMAGDDLTKLGITRARAACIIALAKACAEKQVQLEAGMKPDHVIAQLASLPGIGQWTAHYIAMRALRWPDAFPKEDIAMRKYLGRVTAREAERRSQPWHPWRSYALLHIWRDS